MKRTNVNGGVRCSVTGCRAWSMRSGDMCAGHSPVGRARAREAIQSRRVRLVFPELDSTSAAREWMKVIGQGLVSGQIKPSKGREMRLLAQSFLSSDASGQLADRLDRIEEQIEDLDGAESKA